MHHQLSNIHKLIFSASNTNSGDIFTYSSHFPLKWTEQGCRPSRSRQGKSHHMFTAACDNSSLLSVVGFSSHLVLPPTVCDWDLGFGQLLQDQLRRGKPVLGVLAGSLASFFSSLSVHPRLVAVVGSGHCPHGLLLVGEVPAGRSISLFGSLLGQQTCHVPEERSGRPTAEIRQGRTFCLQLHTSHSCREVPLPPAKVVSDWKSF